MPHKRKKIKGSNIIGDQSLRIKPTEIEIPIGTSFSFRYWYEKDGKFSIQKEDEKYFHSLLHRVRELSKLTVKEISNTHNKSIRCHPIAFEQTTENSFGIPNEEQLVSTPYQLFEVSANKYGRVHGFFIENVAYIVWLDPHHELYSKK